MRHIAGAGGDLTMRPLYKSHNLVLSCLTFFMLSGTAFFLSQNEVLHQLKKGKIAANGLI